MANGQQFTEIESILNSVTPKMTVLDLEREMTPDARKLTVAVTQTPHEPKPPIRAESPAPAHVFHDIAAFTRYVTHYGKHEATTSDVVILADVTKETIAAVLDETAGSGRTVVTFHPEKHPLFIPWYNAIGKKIPVVDFAKFAMERRRSVVDPDGRELAIMLSQVRGESTFTLHTGVGKNALNGLMVRTKIEGTVRDLPIELPESLTIEVPLYLGQSKVRIELDLLIFSPEPDSIYVTITAADLEERFVESFQAMVEQLTDDLPTASCGLGSLQYRSWEYLK
jgi:hypothetical protein